MHGYFGLAHRNAALANERSQLQSYIARLKHSALFHRKLVLADHMVVNSPNFLRAYSDHPDFKDLCDKSLLEVAHFERFKDGRFMSLPELRDFYKRLGLFHPKLDNRFKHDDVDNRLASIESAVVRLFPESTKRDPLFTEYCDAYAVSQSCMNRLGKDYGEFDVAYHFLRENTPILGIINFDPEHATVDDKTIYDYVADLPRNRNQSVDTVIKRLSPALVPSMRALLIRAETTLLGYQPIIPSELAGELDLVLGNVQLMGAKPDDQELDEVALTLDAIDEKTLAELTPSLIMSIRETDEARCFWEIVECSSQKEASLSEIREAAAQYVRRISMDVTRDTWSRGNRKTESVIVRVLRHTLSTSKQNAEVVIGTSIQLGGLLYAPLVVLAPIGQAVAKLLNKSADGETATSSPVVGANLSVSQSTLGRATQHTQ